MVSSLQPSSSVSQLSTSFLEASLSSIRKRKPVLPFFNWARTFTCRPESVFYPTSEEQVRWLVQLAKRSHKCLRAYGAGHSPSDLVCVEEKDWLVNLDSLNQLLQVDLDNHVVTVQAGIRLRDLHPLLRKHGLALSSLGSISDQSLGGAISTATHGSSCKFGNLSSFVKAITIVLADEECSIVTCSSEVERDLFEASRCALGLTGIITRITMQCEPAFRLKEEEFCMSTKEFIRSIQDGGSESMAESAEHVRAWWHPQAGEVKVSRMNRTLKHLTIHDNKSLFVSALSWTRDRLLGYHWHQIGLLIGRVFPNFLTWHARFLYKYTTRTGCFFDTISIPWTNSPRHDESEVDRSFPRCTSVNTKVGDSVEIFNYDCLFPQYTYEGVVPIEQAQACLEEMRVWLEGEMVKTGGMRHHFPIEIRFSAQDDVWMSPTNGMRGCYIGIVQYKPYGLPVTYRALFTEFERMIFAHGGKPHWAKSYQASPTTLTKMFPRLPDFMRVREKVDPNRVFVNPYARRHFLGEENEDTESGRFKSYKQSMEDKVKMP